MTSRVKINLLFVTLCLIWGSTWLAIKIGLSGIPPLTGAAMRFALAGAILYAVSRFMRLRWPHTTAFYTLVGVQALFSFFLTYSLVYWGEESVPSGLASVLYATLPLFTGLISTYGFRIERFAAIHIAGLLCGFAGVGVVYWSEVVRVAHASALGVLAVLGAAAATAVAAVAAKRWAGGIHPIALASPSQLLGSLLLAAVGLIFERGRPLVLDSVTLGSVAYLALFGSAVAFTAYYALLRTVSVTRLSLITYITPIVAVTLGTLVAREHFELHTYAGAALILAGVWLMHVKVGAAQVEKACAPSR